jgi:CheY-like chemotaxis protein
MKKVLLVDDDESFSWCLANALSACGEDFVTAIAGNGREAVKIMEEFPADAIITDLKMPVMDGYEFLLHAKEHFPDIPVFVMTGVKTPETEKRLRSMGVSQYMEKPSDITEVVKQMQLWIQ